MDKKNTSRSFLDVRKKYPFVLIVIIQVFIYSFAGFCISYAQNFSSPRNAARDRWQKPQIIMDSIGVKAGLTIGEVGAGDGYFTFKLARRVGESGVIYANDIKKDFAQDMEEKCKEAGLTNIKTIVGETENPLFPDSTMDMVVMVYVFHDLSMPVPLMKNIKPSLKAGAKVCIIDRDPDRYEEGDYNHFMTKDAIIKKVIEAGYRIDKIYTFLPRDNIYVCTPE
ncbi:class I SAM-dependent methyltransferase [candidate division KSB1 bacterium]|nr:class I SAM-dependent methyltransferase [candidate division KSB1 bacterium]